MSIRRQARRGIVLPTFSEPSFYCKNSAPTPVLEFAWSHRLETDLNCPVYRVPAASVCLVVLLSVCIRLTAAASLHSRSSSSWFCRSGPLCSQVITVNKSQSFRLVVWAGPAPITAPVSRMALAYPCSPKFNPVCSRRELCLTCDVRKLRSTNYCHTHVNDFSFRTTNPR